MVKFSVSMSIESHAEGNLPASKVCIDSVSLISVIIMTIITFRNCCFVESH